MLDAARASRHDDRMSWSVRMDGDRGVVSMPGMQEEAAEKIDAGLRTALAG